ncbi:MAG: Trehalose/maltose import ATP-binding protein MalK [Methanosaeta sp. PtaB.Bin018]|jgi:ABC-2 type transport system ATP-binding protein|nr:ABC transporter ATP-binding protein [Methanothrix sp.]OPX76135.1 MAG: Trehalose/maltose import ATP-binding protein MalK [Methanosaeta sp. PtaB.Bin018]OPY47589.1 MAG: Trehalose/maltose import ATP-binding protein MalK [Methanosaeta sp. PtaU1.Bin016]
MGEKPVQAQGICKSYRRFFGATTTVLKDISMEVETGEIFGLLGPNGSGKTTLISIFSTLIYPEVGRLRILGLDAHKGRDEIRKLINISTAKPNFPWSLTVKENLRHFGMLYGLYGPALSQTVRDQIDAFELGDFQDMKFEDLSTGLKQRLSLAKAMLNRPRLLFLDEPTTGLDPDISMKTRQLIQRIHEEEEISVVLSTHYMPEAEMLCDRIAFLRKGEIVALDTPQNLKNQLGLGEKVTVLYEGSVGLAELERLPGVINVFSAPGRVEMMIDRSAENLDMIVKHFAKARILDIIIMQPDLEDVFLELAR